MKNQILNSMVSFALGTGATLVALASWTGTTDLDAIKQQFSVFESSAETQVNEAVSHYSQVVVDANAEIGEYKDALEQANSNIDKLITAYMLKEEELENANKQAEQDLADLQAELDILYSRMDSQYEADMNEIIEQANAQINQANTEVATTRTQIEDNVNNSGISDGSYLQNQLDEVEVELDITEGKPTVNDIAGIVE